MPLSKLARARRNPKRHDEEAIGASFDAFGYVEPIVRDERTGRLVAGHGRTDRLATLFKTSPGRPPAGVEVKRNRKGQIVEWLVPVVRGWRSKNDGQAEAYLLASNRTTELGGWDDADLAAMLKSLKESGDLLGSGFTDDDLNELVDQFAEGEGDHQVGTPTETWVKRGDLIALGEHRLLCGDATSPEDFERLIHGARVGMLFTDPPYGMALDPSYKEMFKVDSHGSHNFAPVIGDDVDFDPKPVFDLVDAIGVKEQFWWGADYYRAHLPAGGSWLVWDKRGNDLEMNLDVLPGAVFELCWSRVKHEREIARILWCGHHGMQSDDTKTRVHPTQKPAALARWAIDRWAPPGMILDLYAGSGSTLIAAEQSSRVCLAMELSPAYVQVIVERWELYTGVTHKVLK